MTVACIRFAGVVGGPGPHAVDIVAGGRCGIGRYAADDLEVEIINGAIDLQEVCVVAEVRRRRSRGRSGVVPRPIPPRRKIAAC